MAIDASSVTVGTSPTRLTSQSDADVNPWASSLAVALPAGGSTVFVGGPAVTTSTGFPLAAGSSLALDLAVGDEVYAVVASGTQTVNVLRSGV